MAGDHVWHWSFRPGSQRFPFSSLEFTAVATVGAESVMGPCPVWSPDHFLCLPAAR